MKISSLDDINKFIEWIKSKSDLSEDKDNIEKDLDQSGKESDIESSQSRSQVLKQIKEILNRSSSIDFGVKEMCIKYGRNFGEGDSLYSGWFTMRIPEKKYDGKKYVTFSLIIDENDSSTWKFLIIPQEEFNEIIAKKTPDKNDYYHFYISYLDDKTVVDNRDVVTNLTEFLLGDD